MKTCQTLTVYPTCFNSKELESDVVTSSPHEDVFVLIFTLLNELGFERNFQLNVEDQVTLVDIKFFLDVQTTDAVAQVGAYLQRKGIRPISADLERLEAAEALSGTLAQSKHTRKLEILQLAAEEDSVVELECYELVRDHFGHLSLVFKIPTSIFLPDS